MCTDFNGTCAGIGICTYCNAFRQVLFGMIVRVNIHAVRAFRYFLAKGKHGFLCTAADKDFCILADSNIRPVIGRTDIISNLLSALIYNILIRCQSYAGDAGCEDEGGEGGDG